jgi:hypothetical protein
MWGMAWLVEQLLVSKEKLCSMKLVTYLECLGEDWINKVLNVH